MSPQRQANRRIAWHAKNGGQIDRRRECAYVRYADGVTFYLDWSLGELILNHWTEEDEAA